MNLKRFVASVALVVFSTSALADLPRWSYDAGPNPDTALGRELIDITADIPNMPAISKQIMGKKQKFRPAFGPIPWRMIPGENKVKMLFIGQDGTHIAEAAGRPATAGFGGRAQDLAKYFGVNEGAAFINTYSFTIKGQYGIYNTPYFFTKNGETKVRFANLVSNQLWAMSMGLDSPITKWRNDLIDWIIRNNKDSMKLIVTFGGAARDAIATYAISKGATVEAFELKNMDKIQVAETKEQYAGGNNTFPSLVARDGGDLYQDLVGRKLNYSKSKDQKLAAGTLVADLEKVLKNAVFTKGGPHKNGLLNAAQLGGYNLGKMKIKGFYTRSLKGIELNDGTTLENDVLVVELPHPSSLSRTVMDAGDYAEGKKKASERVMKKVKALNKYRDAGWRIEADPGQVNQYDQKKNYTYGRSDIGPEFYDFGTPKNRMVSKSTARRMSGNANVVIIGTRDNGKFNNGKIKKMTNAKAAIGLNNDDLFIARPKSGEARYTFDPGPGEKLAKIMVENLDLKKIFTPKEGMSFEEHGIDAYNVKSHPSVSFFGNYRGTFNNPEVIIMADPMGYDDIVTARALTGARGQHLHALMQDAGVNDNYLVFKTVPFAMDGASKKEWETVVEQTKEYRSKVMAEVLKTGKPKLVIADGLFAFREALRIFKDKGVTVLSLRRRGNNPTHQIKRLVEKFNILGTFGKVEHKVRMANIPRTHLSFYARVWEGTSGDRVITSDGKKYKGIAFAEVVPSWAYNQSLPLTKSSEDGVQKILFEMKSQGLPLPYEKIPRYLERINHDAEFKYEDFRDIFSDDAA
jgi:hypothetical protein